MIPTAFDVEQKLTSPIKGFLNPEFVLANPQTIGNVAKIMTATTGDPESLEKDTLAALRQTVAEEKDRQSIAFLMKKATELGCEQSSEFNCAIKIGDLKLAKKIISLYEKQTKTKDKEKGKKNRKPKEKPTTVDIFNDQELDLILAEVYEDFEKFS
jgi:hypothetical protein